MDILAGDGHELEDFEQRIREELEQARRSLKEVTLMLEQSQAELAKLSQRNAAVTGHLQQLQTQSASEIASELRNAFTSAMEVQQRLLVMRGQLEKLQTEQSGLQRIIKLLEETQTILSDPTLSTTSSGGSRVLLEMVINTQEEVRKRLSQQMHDGPAQALSNFILQTDIAAQLFDMDQSKAKDELYNLKSAAKSTFSKVRNFITELRPMMLDDLGLFPTLRKYVDEFKEQSGQEINISIKGQERRLAPYLEVMIFRAVQELVGNAVRFNADQPLRLQIDIQVVIEDNFIKVIVSDNGKGFEMEEIDQSDGIGIKLIKERVEMSGGTIEVDSKVGKGTRIEIQVPCLEGNSTTA